MILAETTSTLALMPNWFNPEYLLTQFGAYVIIGLCQLLTREQDPRLSPMQRDAVERMERNARTLLQSVNHLLGCLRSGQFE